MNEKNLYISDSPNLYTNLPIHFRCALLSSVQMAKAYHEPRRCRRLLDRSWTPRKAKKMIHPSELGCSSCLPPDRVELATCNQLACNERQRVYRQVGCRWSLRFVCCVGPEGQRSAEGSHTLLLVIVVVAAIAYLPVLLLSSPSLSSLLSIYM